MEQERVEELEAESEESSVKLAAALERMGAMCDMLRGAATIAFGGSDLSARRIRHLPVIDGDTLVGFVSIGDLVKYRIDRIEADAAAMREYIQSA